MAQYDGSIRINTGIDTKGFESGKKELEASTRSAAKSIDASIKEMEKELETLGNSITKSANEIAYLHSKMKILEDAKAPTEEYTKVENQLRESLNTMEKLEEKQKHLSNEFRNLSAEQLQEQVKNAWLEFDKVDEKLNYFDTTFDSLENKRNELLKKLKENPEGVFPDLDVEYNKALEDLDVEYNKTLGEYEKLQEESRHIQRRISEINEAIKFSQKIEEARTSAERLEAKLKSLEKSGKAFTLGSNTEKYAQMEERIAQLNQQMQSDTQRQTELQSTLAAEEQRLAQIRENAVVGNRHIVEIVERRKQLLKEIADMEASGVGAGYQQYDFAKQKLAQLNEEIKDYNNGIGKAKENYKKLGDAAHKSLEKVNKSVKKSGGFMKTFVSRLKGIALSLLIFNWITKAFNSVVKAIKDGFSNLYNDNEKFKNSVDELRASTLTLKNAFAAAFRPLVDVAIPYIQMAADKMTELLNKVGQFTAAITGQKTYTKAIKQTADAFKDAEKAADGYLSPLDEINKFSPSKEEDQTGLMFEEVPISQKFLNSFEKLKDSIKPVIDYAQKLKDVFKQGFFDGLGDWGYRWNSIKDSIQSIKDSLKGIFTDPAVLSSADKWAQSVSYLLGSLAGSAASIGLTIATNLLGGIAKYLDQNKDRIKEYLVSMFDIQSDINRTLAKYFQAFAYVFEAFASESGQQLTANIIGIFADAFMGITELAEKFARDIINIFTKPFIDNKEALRIALEEFLGVLAEVSGTIKQGIDETFDKLNEVYDAHFKPFFDSVAQGLSDLVGQFLNFWNGNVQPILNQWAADFDELWKTHIQPFLNNAAELLGKVADLLKALWQNILQPAISWIIANILPVVLPAIQAIWDMLVDFVGYIADAASSIIDILGGVIDFLTGVFTGDWQLAFQGLENIASGFINFTVGLLEGFVSLAENLVRSLFAIIKTLLNVFIEFVQNAVTSFLDYIKNNIINKGDEIKQGIASFLDGIQNTWSQAWESLASKVESVFESVKNIVKDAISWITEKIDSIKEKFGNIKSAVSGFFGGDSGSGASTYSMRPAAATYSLYPQVAQAISTADIPGYATGQVIPQTMKQHLAILGDNTRETEVVSPLSTIEQAVENVMARINAAGGGRQELTIRIPVYLDGKQITEIVVNNGKIQQMSTGNNPFLLDTP